MPIINFVIENILGEPWVLSWGLLQNEGNIGVVTLGSVNVVNVSFLSSGVNIPSPGCLDRLVVKDKGFLL